MSTKVYWYIIYLKTHQYITIVLGLKPRGFFRMNKKIKSNAVLIELRAYYFHSFFNF